MIILSLILGFVGVVWFNAILTTDNHPFIPRIAHKSWLSEDGALLKYDKLEHLIGTAALTLFLYWLSIKLYLHNMSEWQAAVSALIFGFAWEIKDSFFPCEVYGWIGGDGADVKDFIADVIGTGLAVVLINGLR